MQNVPPREPDTERRYRGDYYLQKLPIKVKGAAEPVEIDWVMPLPRKVDLRKKRTGSPEGGNGSPPRWKATI